MAFIKNLGASDIRLRIPSSDENRLMCMSKQGYHDNKAIFKKNDV